MSYSHREPEEVTSSRFHVHLPLGNGITPGKVWEASHCYCLCFWLVWFFVAKGKLASKHKLPKDVGDLCAPAQTFFVGTEAISCLFFISLLWGYIFHQIFFRETEKFTLKSGCQIFNIWAMCTVSQGKKVFQVLCDLRCINTYKIWICEIMYNT